MWRHLTGVMHLLGMKTKKKCERSCLSIRNFFRASYLIPCLTLSTPTEKKSLLLQFSIDRSLKNVCPVVRLVMQHCVRNIILVVVVIAKNLYNTSHNSHAYNILQSSNSQTVGCKNTISVLLVI